MDKESLNNLYQEVIIDHYKDPRGRGKLECPDAVKHGSNPVCGDVVDIEVEFEGKIIRDITVNSTGCAISVASGSILAELLPGKSIKEARAIAEAFKKMMSDDSTPLPDDDFGDLDALEGVKQFPNRVKCALLAWNTITGILKEWQHKPVKAAANA